MTKEQLCNRLVANKRTAGTPRCSIELEATQMLDQLASSEANGFPVPDSELEALIEGALIRLENDARLANLFRPITDPA
jgi:hypothetical protein